MRLFFPQLAASGLWLTALGLLSAAETPPPAQFIGQLTLVRYDMPLAFSDGFAPTHQAARRKDGEEEVAWPDMTLNGRPIFRGKNEEQIPLKLRAGSEAKSPFQLPSDDLLQPGNHWLRAFEWRKGLRHIYTADGTARTSNAAAAMTGRYELWLFPIFIQGEGGPVVKNVEVKVGNLVVYKQAGPWRSLTLLLPQNEPGKPYTLTVDGRAPVNFQAGLQRVKPGDPREAIIPVNLMIPGDQKISVRNLAKPEEFPHAKEWAADLAVLGKPLPPTVPFDRGTGVHRYLGAEVAVSPLTLYAAALPHGMSGGFFKKGNDPESFAKMVAAENYDTIFESVTAFPSPGDAESFEKRAAALARGQCSPRPPVRQQLVAARLSASESCHFRPHPARLACAALSQSFAGHPALRASAEFRRLLHRRKQRRLRLGPLVGAAHPRPALG
ncbi:MAG: hypothetical protein WDN28_17460 [Chthoniobacter sp.]